MHKWYSHGLDPDPGRPELEQLKQIKIEKLKNSGSRGNGSFLFKCGRCGEKYICLTHEKATDFLDFYLSHQELPCCGSNGWLM
jgi:hypothetical protein